MPSPRLRLLLAAAVLLPLLLPLAARADEVDDLLKTMRETKYGAYWDRLDATKKLGTIGTKKAAEALVACLGDPEPPIVEAVVDALARLKDPEAVKVLTQALLAGRSDKVKAQAAWALELLKEKDTADDLIKALGDGSGAVRAGAARALGAIGQKEAAKPLSEHLAGPPESVVAILHALARLKDDSVFDAVATRFTDANPLVRAAALRAGARLAPDKSLEALQKGITALELPVRLAAVEAFVHADHDAAVAATGKLLDDEAWPVRVAAIECCPELWDKRLIEPMIARMEKEKGRLRFDFAMALKEITGKDIGWDAKAWRGWWDANKDKFELPPKPRRGQKREAKDDGTYAAFFNIPILSDRVCFIIDYSGSMFKMDKPKGPDDGKSAAVGPKRKIDIAIDEFENVLKRLKPEVKVNLIVMSTEAVAEKCRKASPQLVANSEGNRKTLVDFARATCKKLEAIKRGRGDMYDTIHETIADPEVDTVFVLSDGVPSSGQYKEEHNFLKHMNEENEFRKIMIHTVLTGSKGTNEGFMEKVAENTHGVFVAR